MEQLEISAVRPSGVLLPGTLLRRAVAAASSLPVPCIVMLHGVLSHRDHNFAPALAEALFKSTGHAIYRFDFRFNPEPDKEPDFRYRFSGFADDIDDLRVVLARLKSLGYAPWCLVGHSRGANDVLIAADELINFFSGHDSLVGSSALDASSPCSGAGSAPSVEDAPRPPRLAVAALAARFTMPQMFARLFSPEQQAAVDDPEQGHRFVWASKRGDLLVTKDDADVVRCRMDMGATLRRVHPAVPILHMHGDGDEVIPVADAALFLEARAAGSAAAGERLSSCSACSGSAAPVDSAGAGVTHSSPDSVAASASGCRCPRSDSSSSTAGSAGGAAGAGGESRINSRLVVVEGARHAFAGKHQLRTLLRTVTEWVVEQAKVLGVELSPAVDPAPAAGRGNGGKAAKAAVTKVAASGGEPAATSSPAGEKQASSADSAIREDAASSPASAV